MYLQYLYFSYKKYIIFDVRLNLKIGRLSSSSSQFEFQSTNDTIAFDGQTQPSSREPARKGEFSVKIQGDVVRTCSDVY